MPIASHFYLPVALAGVPTVPSLNELLSIIMALSIPDRFLTLRDRVQPTATELERYKRHFSTVRGRLQTVFDSPKVSLMGSHNRATAIKGQSDLDVLLQLPRDEIRWGGRYTSSRTVLGRVREALLDRYPRTTISVSGPAVVVKFDGYPVDVVPAVFLGVENGSEVLAIPDGSGDWMRASPKAHDRYLAGADESSRGKLKVTAQLLKFWRYTRTTEIPIQSFHVEMLLATSGLCIGGKSYSACLRDAFIALADAESSPPVDPLGISGVIPVARTTSQARRVNAALGRTVDQAVNAREAEEHGDQKGASQWWNKVFKGCFPKQ